MAGFASQPRRMFCSRSSSSLGTGSTPPKEDHNVKEDEESAFPTFNDVKFHKLHCFQKSIDGDQDMLDQPNIEAATDAKVLEVVLNEPPESEENSMEIDPQFGNEDNSYAPPISFEIYLCLQMLKIKV